MGTTADMENQNELLCSYASLILASSDMDVTADNINAIVKAAGAKVPAFYPALWEKVNANNSVKDMVENAGKVGSGAPAAGGAAPAAAAKEESDDDDADMAPAAN